VSRDQFNFDTLAGSATCVLAQNNQVCYFDYRRAVVTGLTVSQVYYYRVVAVTIVGDGQNATALPSPMIYIDCSAGNSIDSSGLCAPCAAGTYKPSSGSASCTACGAGTYTESAGASACFSCAAGTYKESSGSGSCILCPVNTVSLNTGSFSVSDCVCALGYGWNESYTRRRLLQQDVTYNCLAGEGRILVTDPVPHYVCRALPPPPPPPVEQCESSPAEPAPPQKLPTSAITDAYEGDRHSVIVQAPRPRRLSAPPAVSSYASYNYHVTRRLLQMELTVLPGMCVPCESSFYKNSVSNTRCQQCPADMSSQGGVNCTTAIVATVTATPAPDPVSAPEPDVIPDLKRALALTTPTPALATAPADAQTAILVGAIVGALAFLGGVVSLCLWWQTGRPPV
jgi:hypothetical protein